MTKEQEETLEKVNRIRIDFFDSKYKDVHTDDELEEKYEALGDVLNMLKENSAEIEQKNTEIEKKNKQIKLMAQTILENTSELKTFWCNGCTQIANCPYKEAVNCIEDFFERKSRE